MEEIHIQHSDFKTTAFKKVKQRIYKCLPQYSRSISMVGYGKFFEKGFISESKFLNESTPSGQKILPKVPL